MDRLFLNTAVRNESGKLARIGQLEGCQKELLLIFLRIALFAGLAFFLGFDTALVFALFTGSFGLVAAAFGASDGQATQKGDCTSDSSECFHRSFPLLVVVWSETEPVYWR